MQPDAHKLATAARKGEQACCLHDRRQYCNPPRHCPWQHANQPAMLLQLSARQGAHTGINHVVNKSTRTSTIS